MAVIARDAQAFRLDFANSEKEGGEASDYQGASKSRKRTAKKGYARASAMGKRG